MCKGINQRAVFRYGKKVILRPIEKEDLGKIMIWVNDPEVTRYLSMIFPHYKKEEEEWIERLAERKNTDIVLGIETKKRIYIGSIGLHHINWVDRTVTIGIFIGEKIFWSKGYGRDAIMTILDYAFNSLNLRKACLTVLGFNKRGINCYRNCGFKLEGRRKKFFYRNGHYTDEIIMGVFKSNWLKTWEEYKKT